MATDLAAIVANLVACVPLEGKRVLWVGAGGGQLVAWARVAREVVAVDSDPAATETLLARAAEAGWHVLDDEKIVRSWRAVEERHPLSVARFETQHVFATLDELVAKVRSAGPEAVDRARTGAGGGPIAIRLSYAIARLGG